MITEDDIRTAVAPNAFAAGRQYFLNGRVRSTEQPRGGIVNASVMGSGRSAYKLHIQLGTRMDGRTMVAGRCSCPVGFNCKHVAAALLAFRAHPPETAREAALPPEIQAWLGQLEQAQVEASDDYPDNIRKRLLYVLQHDDLSGHVWSELHSSDTSGSIGKMYRLEELTRSGAKPKFLRRSDSVILRGLSRDRPSTDQEFIETLRAIIRTGRGRWRSADGPVLNEGEARPAAIAWTMLDDGRQKPHLDLPAPLIALLLASPWYADPRTGTVGPVETAFSARVIRAMLSAPPVSPAVAGRVAEEMARRWPDGGVPQPAPLALPRLVQEPLQPELRLIAGDLSRGRVVQAPYDRYRGAAAAGPAHLPLARVSWRYGPVSITPKGGAAGGQMVRHGGELLQLARDQKAEHKAMKVLHDIGFVSTRAHYTLPPGHPHEHDHLLSELGSAAWIDFILDDAAELKAAGWQIEIEPDFPVRLAEPAAASFQVGEGSGIDWLDLDLGVMVDGERISLVPALVDFIGNGDFGLLGAGLDDPKARLLVTLPDGRVMPVPTAQFRPILAPLLELFANGGLNPQTGAIRLSRSNLGDIALIEAASAQSGIVWQGGDAIRSLGRQLREHGGIPPCTPPADFKAELRPYQAQGLAWLQFLAAAGLGGILADDMGLGKTVQALAHIAVDKAAGRLDRPALIICPTSLVPNWLAEATRFAPTLRVLVLHGPDRARRFGAIAAHDLVITTYPLLARDHAVLTAQQWHMAVLDEAQVIKNPLAGTSQLARTLQARQRLCLSGTPLENHLGELWSLFDFLLPGFLGAARQFGVRYRTPIEKEGDGERQAMLAQRVAPFLLRRTKEQVAADLPPKTEITEAVEMQAGQRAIYEAVRLTMHAKVKAAVKARGLAGSGIIILDALLKLRQACCDPRLLKLATARTARARSAKLERLMEMLPQMLEEGRRVLLFSQFTSMLALIEEALAHARLPHVLLTGDTRDRRTPVAQFQDGRVPLFLISLKAGGVGLNLTAADTVIHYDPWWNPAVEDQATDRAHRIGQDKAVFVHRLITTGTIEEKMEVLKARKQALADGILGAAGGTALALSEGDLDVLLGA